VKDLISLVSDQTFRRWVREMDRMPGPGAGIAIASDPWIYSFYCSKTSIRKSKATVALSHIPCHLGYPKVIPSGLVSLNRSVLHGILAVCAVAWFVCDAHPLYAGCGDYVLVNGSKMPSHSSMGHPRTSLRDPVSHRCTGPQCRQRQKSPLSPGESVSVTQPTDLILLAFDAPPSTSLRSGAICEGLLVPADAPADSIFKPPRG
jgi:hypothetical protein